MQGMMATLSLVPAGVLFGISANLLHKATMTQSQQEIWVTPVVGLQRDSGNQRWTKSRVSLIWVCQTLVCLHLWSSKSISCAPTFSDFLFSFPHSVTHRISATLSWKMHTEPSLSELMHVSIPLQPAVHCVVLLNSCQSQSKVKPVTNNGSASFSCKDADLLCPAWSNKWQFTPYTGCGSAPIRQRSW